MINGPCSSELLHVCWVDLESPVLIVRIVLNNQNVLLLRDHLRQHTVDDLGQLFCVGDTLDEVHVFLDVHLDQVSLDDRF